MIRNKKQVPDAVLDDEGRQRFHGAFTGGFSAGHYNTVGSEEGFKPTAFVSSRNNRAARKEQSANDFVDSEDGLLGAVLSAKNEQVTIDLEDSSRSQKNVPHPKDDYYGIGYDPAVDNAEVNAYRSNSQNNSRLFQRQKGHGQGVYRMDSLISSNSANIPSSSSSDVTDRYKSRNMSDSLRNKGVQGFSLNDDEDDVYDNLLIGVAPGHNGDIDLNQRDMRDDHLSGLAGLGLGSGSGSRRYLEEQVGSDDDDDDDTFATGNIGNIGSRGGRGGRGNKKGEAMKSAISASVDNWLGSKVGGDKIQQRCPTDGKNVLSGFVLSTKEQVPPVVLFAAPIAPKGYVALHVFEEDKVISNGSSSINISCSSSSNSSSSSSGGVGGSKYTDKRHNNLADRRRAGLGGAAASGILLGEETVATTATTATAAAPVSTQGKSVFELLGEKGRQQIKAAIDGRNENEKAREKEKEKEEEKEEEKKQEKIKAGPSRPMLTSDVLLKSTFAGLSQAFHNRFVTSSAVTPSESGPIIVGLTTAAEHAEISALSAAVSSQSTAGASDGGGGGVVSTASAANIATNVASSATSSSSSSSSSSSTNSNSIQKSSHTVIPGSTASFLSHPQVSKMQSLSNYASAISSTSSSSSSAPSSSAPSSSVIIAAAAATAATAAATGGANSSSNSNGSGNKSSVTGTAIGTAKEVTDVKAKKEDPSSLKGKASRHTRAWYPVPLLSRRFNIKVDGDNIGTKGGRHVQDRGGGGGGGGGRGGGGDRIVDAQLNSMFAGIREEAASSALVSSFGTSKKEVIDKNDRVNKDIFDDFGVENAGVKEGREGQEESGVEKGDKERENEVSKEIEKVEKPPMTLFKSIFEDSDSDSESSDSDDDDDKEEDDDDRNDNSSNTNINDINNEKNDKSGQKITPSTGRDNGKDETVASTLLSKSIALSKSSKNKDIDDNTDNSNKPLLRMHKNDDSNGKSSDDRYDSNIAAANMFKRKFNQGNDDKTEDERDAEKGKDRKEGQEARKGAGKGIKGEEKMIVTEKDEEREKEEEKDEERVVFRKPAAKARVNTFSTRPKTKRTYTVMSYDDDEGDDEGKEEKEGKEEEERQIEVVKVVKKKKRIDDKSDHESDLKADHKNDKNDKISIKADDNIGGTNAELDESMLLSEQEMKSLISEEEAEKAEKEKNEEKGEIEAAMVEYDTANIDMVISSNSDRSDRPVLPRDGVNLSSDDTSNARRDDSRVAFAIDRTAVRSAVNFDCTALTDGPRDGYAVVSIDNRAGGVGGAGVEDTEEGRMVSAWYKRNEEKKKEREEMVRIMRSEENEKEKEKEEERQKEKEREKEEGKMKGNDNKKSDKKEKKETREKDRKEKRKKDGKDKEKEKENEKERDGKDGKESKKSKSKKSKKSKKSSHKKSHDSEEGSSSSDSD